MLELLNYNIKESFISSFEFNSKSLTYQQIKNDIYFKNNLSNIITWPNDTYITTENNTAGTRFVLNKTVNYNTEPEGKNTADNLLSYNCYGVPKTIDITCTNILSENRIGQFSINLKNDKGEYIVLFAYQKFWTSIADSISKTYPYFNPICNDGFWLCNWNKKLEWTKDSTERKYNINLSNYTSYLTKFKETKNTIHISIPPISMNWSNSFWKYNLLFYIKNLKIVF